MKRLCLFAAAALFAYPAAPAGKFALTIDNIMRGPALAGYEPSQIRWSGRGERIYFEWKRAGDPLEKTPDTYAVNRDGAGLHALPDDEAKQAPPFSGDSAKDGQRVVYARDGDIFLYDNRTEQTRPLTKTSDLETDPHWLRDGKRVYFTRANNLYVVSIEDGSTAELTDIRMAAARADLPAPRAGRTRDAEEEKGTASQEYLKKEQQELLEAVRDRAAHRKAEEEKRKRENPRKPFLLQPRQSIAALQLSPDERYVIATVTETSEKAKRTIVPNYITESAYTEDIQSRENVGDPRTQTKLAVLSVATGAVKWVDPGRKEEPPAGALQTEGGNESGGETGKDRGEKTGENNAVQSAQKERETRLSLPVWSEDGARAALLARSADNKDRWVLALDPATAKTRVLAGIHDEAWVDGPGATTLGWMKSDRDVYFQSEQTGYSHLYTVSYDGGQPRALTSGRWEVDSVKLSKDKSRFFLTTSEADPGERHVYEMSASGGERTRLTRAAGKHAPVFSPDERWMADLSSYTNRPPELFAQQAQAGAEAKKLTSSPAAEFWEYPWLDAPIVTFPARDGATLRARIYRPANFRKNGPAVVFVHGAGYLQNVHRWWSSYYREYMFHHFLMERGYLTLDVDYRGSAGYGRDWRAGIYRHMGGQDLDDEVDAARWLASAQGVDPKRIGIYGGSYGGFITLMAMFTQPDVFAAGAALRPVTDWAHYNNGYTSNILNAPQNDPDAYRASSPLFYAQNLRGALLICHGMVDTNVHFQDTVRLAQRLIELRKQNWELAVYPVEDHGFIQPTSWADEYKRIFALFEKNLKPGA